MEILAELHYFEIVNPDWKAKYNSGFRCNVKYDSNNYCCSVSHGLSRAIKQGETHICEICFLTHEPHIGKIKPGMDIELFTGNVTFAEGKVTCVYDVGI